MASTGDTATWTHSSTGLSPLDVALGVAIPEFDGRIIGPPLSFKEVVDDGDQLGVALAAHRAVPDRVERIAGLATRLARLRHLNNADKRVGVILTAYPTKRSRIGNAVALDTPESLLRVLDALAQAGYKVDEVPEDSDAFMARLADGLTYDQPRLSPAQQAMAVGRLPVDDYVEWFATLPAALRTQIEADWGPAPGDVSVHDGHLVFAGADLGHVAVAVQPPRGFGQDPIGTYHAPDLPPPHHYLAFYRWLDAGFGADALVHMGKHGTLEWLPGKGTGPSSACIPDAALGDLPLLYPFVVNDPGEGAQAKRRTHAVVVDHLPPPMTRAETYDELTRVERLLDEHAKIESLDPSKLPAIRGQLWDLLVTSELARDLGVEEMPDPDDFSGMIQHVDGYLCALKDAQIRGGLHVLGQAPVDEALVDSVLAITRQPQGVVPSLRATVATELGVDLDHAGTADVDRVEAEALCRVKAALSGTATQDPTLTWITSTLVPALRRTPDELTNLLAGLDGRHVPAGPSGAPTRGGAHVLPTGRNFYSVDPKAIPSPLAWDVGVALADRLVERHLAETGAHPRTVGLVVWGTANMRTQGDDVAEALALLGVRPVWHPHSGRVEGLEVMTVEELGRPRVDVTVRISGFFRDAFPGVVTMLDDAVGLVAARDDESPEQNPIRAAGTDDARVFGPGPGRMVRGSGRPSRTAHGAPGPTWPRCTWRGAGSPTAGTASASPPPTRCGAGSPPSTSPSRTRTTASTTSSTATTTSRTTAAWWRPPPSCRGVSRGRGSATRPTRPGRRSARWPRRRPGSCAHGSSTPSGWRPCAATATRAPSRWPPPSTTSSATTPPPAWSRTGCTSGSPRPMSATRRCGSSTSGRTRGPCAASASGSSRPTSATCGRPALPPSTPCATGCWRPRAARSAGRERNPPNW